MGEKKIKIIIIIITEYTGLTCGQMERYIHGSHNMHDSAQDDFILSPARTFPLFLCVNLLDFDYRHGFVPFLSIGLHMCYFREHRKKGNLGKKE